jgi:ectoine hydroxylase-related dioxygenase (phytanoyl-CoA dioxygenase family)
VRQFDERLIGTVAHTDIIGVDNETGHCTLSSIRTVGLHHLPSNTPAAEIAAHIQQHGYAILDDVVDADVLDRLDREVEPFVTASAHGRDVYDGRHTRRTGALIARSLAARELVMHPVVLGAVRAFLSHVTAVQLHLTQLISIEPGETAQKLHRDQMAFDFYPFPPDYHVQCNTMWALTDFTAENGATHIVSGSSAVSDAAAVQHLAVVEQHAAAPHLGLVVRQAGGGANRSTGVRRGVNITYAVGWVRQEENQFLACPANIARTLDDDLLRLMGYQQGAFALGYVGDQQDPLAYLRGQDGKVKVIGDIAEQHADARDFVRDLE